MKIASLICTGLGLVVALAATIYLARIRPETFVPTYGGGGGASDLVRVQKRPTYGLALAIALQGVGLLLSTLR